MKKKYTQEQVELYESVRKWLFDQYYAFKGFCFFYKRKRALSKIKNIYKNWHLSKNKNWYNPDLKATVYNYNGWSIGRFDVHYHNQISKGAAKKEAFMMWYKTESKIQNVVHFEGNNIVLNHLIIGISGISGAGTTKLTKALGEKFGATCLFWDDYDDVSTSPDDYVQWYENGANCNAFDYPKLAKDILELKLGKTAYHPTTKKTLEPTPFIFIDAPLGRLHEQTSKHIDLCIHLDTPLDIALARRIIRDNHASKEQIIDALKLYLTKSRKLFINDDLKKSADFVIDGCLSTIEQIEIVQKHCYVYTCSHSSECVHAHQN